VRVVQVCPFFSPHVGGVETHVDMVSRELVRKGHQVTVLTSAHQKGLPLVETSSGGYTIRRVPASATLLRTPLALRSGRALLAIEPRPDVVHIHYPPPVQSYLVTRALRGSSLPTCLTYHCDLYLEGPLGRALTAIYERIFLPPTLAVCDRIIVHSSSYARTSRALQGREVSVIPSLVDTTRFAPRPDDPALRAAVGAEGKQVVLFVGRLVPHKGVEDLVLAVPDLPKDALLIIAGDGPRRHALESLVRARGLEDRVRFVGSVSGEDLPRYHAIAEVVALPSQNRLEGFGLAIVEAMASGRPAVVADLPGVREVIEDGKDGLLAEPLLAGDLARKVGSLLGDPARRRAMGAQARESAVRKYRLEVVVGQLEALYRELAETH
jgi:glycosyltransferase involved in cell wall biosynthesis